MINSTRHPTDAASIRNGHRTAQTADQRQPIDADVTHTMLKLATEKGYTVVPDVTGDHWFPEEFLVGELLGKEVEYSFTKEKARWRKSGMPFPHRHPGVKGIYYRMFDFLGNYYEWKTQVSKR
ncbi:MAG: hypothetical protein HUJ26_18735 [Planctomycetaceae bacterium]|nr:hypothetical protein [Planctomycetaceae bacterium]